MLQCGCAPGHHQARRGDPSNWEDSSETRRASWETSKVLPSETWNTAWPSSPVRISSFTWTLSPTGEGPRLRIFEYGNLARGCQNLSRVADRVGGRHLRKHRSGRGKLCSNVAAQSSDNFAVNWTITADAWTELTPSTDYSLNC